MPKTGGEPPVCLTDHILVCMVTSTKGPGQHGLRRQDTELRALRAARHGNNSPLGRRGSVLGRGQLLAVLTLVLSAWIATGLAVVPAAATAASVSFTSGTGYNSGSTPQSVVLGKVAGHAAPDIVTANGSGDSLSTLLNNGNGAFSQPATVSPAGTGVAPSRIALGDFTGNGILDAAVVNGSSTVYVMPGNGHGGFGPATAVGTLPNQQSGDFVKVYDMNGDGKADLVVAGTLPNSCINSESATSVLLGNGNGTFQSPVQYPTSDCGGGFNNYGSGATGLAIADVNGDGHPDIVLTSSSSDTGTVEGYVYVLLNNGIGTFGTPTRIGQAGGIYAVAVGYLTANGHADIVTEVSSFNGTQRGIYVFDGNGDGTFQSPTYIADPALTDGTNVAGQGTGISIADVNGDGSPDIVTADSASLSGPSGISVYLNGGGSINSPTFFAAPSYFSPADLALGDVNCDGRPDAVLASNNAVDSTHPANVLVMLNTPSGGGCGGGGGGGAGGGCVATSVPRSAFPTDDEDLDIRGCFAIGSHGTYVSSGNVEVNGIEFSPHVGGQITIDPSAPMLRATGAGVVRLGGVAPVWVWAGAGGLDVPLSGTTNLMNNSNAKLFGFPIVGSLRAAFSGKEANVTGSVSLRALGDDINATLTMITDNQTGVAGASVEVKGANEAPGHHELSSCSFSKPPPIGFECATVTNEKGNTYSGLVPSEPSIIHIGPIAIEDLELAYDGAKHEWSGQTEVAVGALLPGPAVFGKLLPTFGVGVQIGTRPFQLDGLSASDSELNLHLGPATITDFSFHLKLHRTLGIGGNAEVTATGGIGINAGFDLELGKMSGFELKLDGTVSIKTVTISGFLMYDGRDGEEKVTLGGTFTRTFGPVSASLSLRGGVEPQHFELDGSGSIGAFGANVSGNGVLSDAGVGACGQIHVLFFSGDIGFKHFWSGETDFDGCDFSGLHPAGLGGAVDTAVGRSVRLPGRLAREEFAAVGATAAPNITLTGPGGERLSTPAIPDHITITKQGLAVSVTSSKTTYFIVTHPRPGRWTLAPAPGATAPTRYELASPLRPLAMVAHVTGHGRTRSLDWSFAKQPGVSVRFIQEGGTQETITSATRGRGHAPFTVANGAGGRRRIVALVSVQGIPRKMLTVASFQASSPPLPRVTRASYRLKRGNLSVKWARVARATYYDIAIQLTNGVGLEYRLAGRTTTARFNIGRQSHIRRLTLTVTARGLTGPPVRARLA